jgi:predicted DNA-binding protein YlxM (UPF0122 family)
MNLSLHCGCHFRRVEEQDAAPRVTKKRKREFVSQAQLHDNDDVQPSDFKRLQLTYNVARSRRLSKPLSRNTRLPIAGDEQTRRTEWSEAPDFGLTRDKSGNNALQDYQMHLMLLEEHKKKRRMMARQELGELSRLSDFQNIPEVQRDLPDLGFIRIQSGKHMLQDFQMQLMLLEKQNKKRITMARQEQDNFRGSARLSSMGDPQNRGSPINFVSYMGSAIHMDSAIDADFNKAFSSPANTNVAESTAGVLKEPSLTKEAGQGLLSLVSSYARGDMGGMASAASGIPANTKVGDTSGEYYTPQHSRYRLRSTYQSFDEWQDSVFQ